MPKRLLRRKPGEAKRSGAADETDHHHVCNDCGWEREGQRRGTSGYTMAYEHAKDFDHHTTMIVTQYYHYEGRYA